MSTRVGDFSLGREGGGGGASEDGAQSPKVAAQAAQAAAAAAAARAGESQANAVESSSEAAGDALVSGGSDAEKARVWERTFLSSPDTALKPTISFSSPIQYAYGAGEVTAVTTPSTVSYQQQITRGEFVRLVQSRLANYEGLDGYTMEVVRFFKPEPTTVIVRWRAEWGGAGGGADGSTKYKLSSDGGVDGGVVTHVEETWEFKPKPGAQKIDFFNALDYCKARSPPGANALLPATFMPPVKLAAWELLKDDPNYGGQLIREEMDVVTEQVVIAFFALSISVSLLAAEVLHLAVHGCSFANGC